MAYLKKDDLVIIPSAGGANIQARVVDMQFRRFRRSWKDKATGETKSRWKSVPYAVCECFLGAPIGTEFVSLGTSSRTKLRTVRSCWCSAISTRQNSVATGLRR